MLLTLVKLMALRFGLLRSLQLPFVPEGGYATITNNDESNSHKIAGSLEKHHVFSLLSSLA
jgi:hypothetical protein